MHLQSTHVEVCGKECGSAPISVVNCAIEKKLQVTTNTTVDKYDEIFCVVDIDDHISLKDAIQKARDNDLELIISNPCFEYWYILHFKKTGSSYSNRPQLYKELETLLSCRYEKSSCGFFEKIYPLTETAIENAKAILRSQWQNETDLSKCNPSTTVYRVVESIMDIAS